MNKQNIINCNITKDLLPSYLEDICTQDTKKAVNQHLQNCNDCRSLAKLMRETDFVSTKTSCAELDYMKKIKSHLIKRLIGGVLLTTAILFGLVESITNNFNDPKWFLLALPFLLVVTNVLLPLPNYQKEITRKQKILAGIGAAVTCYVLILSVVFAINIQKWEAYETWPFFLKQTQVGPFLSIQFHAGAVYLSAMYFMETCYALRGKPASFICMSIYLTGSCTILAQEACLHILTDLTYWKMIITRTAFVSIIEGILITLIITLIRKKQLTFKH